MPTDELRSGARTLELLGMLEYEIEAMCETSTEEFRREYHEHARKTLAEIKRRIGKLSKNHECCPSIHKGQRCELYKGHDGDHQGGTLFWCSPTNQCKSVWQGVSGTFQCRHPEGHSGAHSGGGILW